MDEEKQTLNPYTPSAEFETGQRLPQFDSDEQQKPRASLLRTTVRWFLVCTISAVPSYVFGVGISQAQISAMIIGILMFIVAYTCLDYVTATTAFRQNRRVARTLKIAYGSRIAISIIYPIAFVLDMFCGMVSISVTETISGSEVADGSMGFAATLFTTLVQGIVLNVVLGVYALLVHAIQLVVIAIRR